MKIYNLVNFVSFDADRIDNFFFVLFFISILYTFNCFFFVFFFK